MSEREEKCGVLTGKYYHSLDAKNRLIIPAKLKEQLGETVTILRGSDKCLTVYSAEEMQSLLRDADAHIKHYKENNDGWL